MALKVVMKSSMSGASILVPIWGADERDQSWSKIDDHGREEREWYREAAEAAPGPQDCEETRPCRSPCLKRKGSRR